MRKHDGRVRFFQMRWFKAKNIVEISDREGELQVRVALQSGEINLALSAGFLLLGVYLLLVSRSWGERLILLVLAADSLDDLVKAFVMKGSVMKLRVSSTGLEVEGRSSRDSTNLSWQEVSGLEYQESGLFRKGGLLARRGGLRSKLLLPFIDRRETKKITDVIYERFPLAEMAEEKR